MESIINKEWQETEFGKMPNDWKEYKLGDVIDFLTDYHSNGAYKVLKENVELKDTPEFAVMIRTTNFEQGDFTNNLKYITEHAYNFLKKSKVFPNDILMNKIANAGSVYMMPDLKKPVSLAMNLFLMRVNQNFNPHFIFQFLKSKEPYIKLRAKGTVTKTITKDEVKNFNIYVPPLLEQEKIASILKSLNDKIELNNQMNQTLEEMAQTIFKEWFVEFNFPNKDGVPYKDNGGEMVESELGIIPKGWRVEELGNLVKTFNGYSYKGKELGESNDAMLTIKNFDRNGGFKINGYKEINISEKVKPHHYVQVGDIVVAHTDLTQSAEIIGNPVHIQTKGKYDNIIISMDTVKVETTSEFLPQNVLYYLLKNRMFKSHALGYVNGTTVLHLNKKAIPEYKFTLTHDIELAARLNSILSQFIKKQNLIIEENQTLIKTRDILLPKLMNGEVRV